MGQFETQEKNPKKQGAKKKRKTHAVKLFLLWSFIQMFPQGFQRRRVEKEKIAQGRRAGKYSRKKSISGYRKLADIDRIVNGQEQISA